MSAQGTPLPPAGWYPDPDDGTRGRYWDGSAWTDLRHVPGTPYPVVPPPKAPEGTGWNTVWIWLVILLPLVPTLFLLFVPWASVFDIDLDDPRSASLAGFSIFLSPFYWIAIVSSYVVYGLTVFFAYRDWKQLQAMGVPKPFHWAWQFLSPVYPFGRSIVVMRRTGRGHATLWAEIGVIVAGFAISIVILALMFSGMADLIREAARYS